MLKIWKKFGIINILLLPISLLYYLIHLINYHILQKPRSVDAKVICVGNITVGGSGKTPYSIHLFNQLSSKTENSIAFISRGYGGNISSNKVHKVLQSDNYQLVGDEPLLLSQFAPTYICKNRYLAAKRAISDGANIIIMDDGMQNNTLKKDEIILVIDSYNGFGNGLILPAGPLREPYSLCKDRVDRIVIIGDGNIFVKHNNIEKLKPCILNISEILNASKERKYVLLTAIANSKRVIDLLKSYDIDIMHHKNFPDHSDFTDSTLEEMKIYNHKGYVILTTMKDFKRIPKSYHKFFIVLDYALNSY